MIDYKLIIFTILIYILYSKYYKRMEIPREQVIIEGENVRVEEHYASIIEFKKNQMKINLVLSLPETEEEEKQQLLELKQNIENALKQELALLKQKQKKHHLFSLSLQLLTASDNGKLSKCFLVEQKKWKNAEVIEVDVEEQTAKIKRYGQQQIEEFPAFYLKVLKEPDSQLFSEGAHCKAIYSGDGQFYPCIIQKIIGDKYQVRYKKYNTVETIKLHRLRPMESINQKKQEIKFQNLNEFKVPDKLKILPSDPQNVKKSKKNKVKALKFAFKNAQVEQVTQEKKSRWQDWNQNSDKAGHFKTKYDQQIFKNNERKN